MTGTYVQFGAIEGRTIDKVSLGRNACEFGTIIALNHLLKITSVLSRGLPKHADTHDDS